MREAPLEPCADAVGPLVFEGDSVEQGFASFVSLGPDADGDRRGDLMVGTFYGRAGGPSGSLRGRLFSGRTGAEIRSWGSDGPIDRQSSLPAVLGPDADGDGLGDVVLGLRGSADESRFRGPGSVELFTGAGSRLARFEEADEYLFGGAVSLGPDVDGDGRGDVLIGSEGTGQTYLYSGASGALIMRGETDTDWLHLGLRVELGPDADGDGAGDAIIQTGFRGGDSMTPAELRSRVTGETLGRWQGYRSITASIGPDADGDGLGDVALAFAASGGAPRALLLVSLARWLPATAADVVRSISLGPDIDGDGRGDVALGIVPRFSEGVGRAELYGSCTGWSDL